jgi:hypothetical protein
MTFASKCSINRYYDPSTNQFLSVDPKVQETNEAYVFAAGNPFNLTDPLGLKGCRWWNIVCGVKKHWHGIAQTVTVVASGIGSAACIAATGGLCAIALPEIGAATASATYLEGGGKHTMNGLASAAGEGTVVGTAAAVCVFACPSFGLAAALAVVVNAGSGALQGAFDYSRSPGNHSTNGYLRSVGNGAIQGAVPWDRIWSKIGGGD